MLHEGRQVGGASLSYMTVCHNCVVLLLWCSMWGTTLACQLHQLHTNGPRHNDIRHKLAQPVSYLHRSAMAFSNDRLPM